MKKKTMVIDLDRCIGCYSCEVSCKMENSVALGVNYNKVLTLGPTGTFPKLEMYYLSVLCQSCKDAPCVEVCPTKASHFNENGAVLIDKEKCIACLSCMEVCPYGARSFNAEAKVVEKCTLCEHLTGGELPACVKVCCAKARYVGDADDPNSIVNQKIKDAGKDNVFSMPDEGNTPTVRYILHGKTAKWQKREKWQFFPES